MKEPCHSSTEICVIKSIHLIGTGNFAGLVKKAFHPKTLSVSKMLMKFVIIYDVVLSHLVMLGWGHDVPKNLDS